MLPAATARKRHGNPVAIDGNLGGVTGTALNNYLSRLAEWSDGAIWEREPWKGLTEGGSVGVNMTPASINKVLAFVARPEFSAGRMRGDISMIMPMHLDRAVPQNNAAAVVISNTLGAGDDAKVWSAAKDGNARWMVGQWVNAVGDYFRIWQTTNEDDGNAHRICAYHPTNTGTVGGFSNGNLLDMNTCLSRLVVLQKALWEEVRGPCRYNRWPRPHIAIATPPLAEASKKAAKASYMPFTIYDMLAYNSGEILRSADLVLIHAYDECMNFALANPGAAVLSVWHVWTAIINGQNAASLGRVHGLGTNEQGIDERLQPPPLRTTWNHGSDFGDGTRSEAWDATNAPIHAGKLTARRRLKARRTGAMAAHNVFWAICLTTYYNFTSSPDDGMNLCPGAAFTPREPAWTAAKTLLDFERYRLTGYGPWPLTIAAKPWASFTNNLTIATVGFHDPLTWLIVAGFDQPEKADPASTTVRTWHEWDRATITNNQIAFTAPVAGQGIQLNTAIRVVWVPLGGWYRATVNFSGNTGTVRLYIHGHDKVNGMSMPADSSIDAAGTLTILFGTRGHRARGAPNLPIFCVCLEASKAANFSSPVLKAESVVQESAAPPPVEPPPEPEPGVCFASTTDLFLNPGSKAFGMLMPQGSGRTLTPATDRKVVLWKKFNGAVVNRAVSGWGCGIWDCRSTTGTQQVTVVFDGAGGGASQFPVTCRIPNGFGTSFNGPDGTDQHGVFLQPNGDFVDFWKLRLVGGVWKAGSRCTMAATAPGTPRSTSASGIWHQCAGLRLFHWTGAGKCERAIGVALQGGTGSNYQLGRSHVWPALSEDGSAGTQPADGILYGSFWVMPRPGAEGGPDPNSLGLGAAGSVAWRLYEQARDYGWVVIDKSTGPSIRGDQTITAAFATEFAAATGKLWQYMRMVTDVGPGGAGADPIGGGTPLAPNCAFDRPAGPVAPNIQSVSWWANRYDATADLNFFLDNSLGTTGGVAQPKDSWPMYQLALGIDGNTSLYRATGNTAFLDRSLLYIENCINRAVVSNNANFPSSQYKDGFLGWIDLTHPKNTHGLEQALYEFYWGRYVMQTLYHARNQPGYSTRIANILEFMETNIWTKWHGRNSGQSQLYRSVIHICAHSAIVALYGREMFVSATVRGQCQTVLDNIDSVGMTLYTQAGVKASIRRQLLEHPANANAYIWRMYWPSENQSEPWYSDQAHSDAVIPYIVAAVEQGYGGWGTDDINKLLALAGIVWPNATTYYYWLLGQGGNNGEKGEGNFSDGIAKLGGFNAAFQKRIEGHTVSASTQLFGVGALNAARLLGTLTSPGELPAQSGEGTPLVSIKNNKLAYNRYANRGDTLASNTIPDFSFAGYEGGGVPLPNVPTKATLSPGALSDDTPRIQAAINTVAALPLVNGYRGAVLLNAGAYKISNMLNINTSGVVLRGAGQGTSGTVITATEAKVYDAITVGSGSSFAETGTHQAINTSFVAVGSRSFNIASASGFVVGNQILVVRTPNAAWIAAVHGDVRGWIASDFEVRHFRKITAVSGNTITVDIPIMDTIEDKYGGGYVVKFSNTGRVEHVGIEDIRIESYFASATDENHGHNAINLTHVSNCWVRRVTSRYFWWGTVNVDSQSMYCTIEDTASLDPKSVITGSRRYAFNNSGCHGILFNRCYARGSRHTFVTGARGAGPNVWLDCLSEDNMSVNGPHQKWAVGSLYDNTKGVATTSGSGDFPGYLNVELRAGLNNPEAAVHGWAGAQNLFWNTNHPTIVCDAPAGAMNWVIGGNGIKAESEQTPSEPFGWWEYLGATVDPRSIYLQQLKDRLGQAAVDAVTLPAQLDGRIWDALSAWAGNGRLEDFLPSQETRSRVMVSGGTVVTDTGTLLRGCTMDLRTSTNPVSSNAAIWQTIRNAGINTVRYDVKTVLNGRTVAQQIPYIDAAVDNAESHRMYIMLMQSVAPGGYNKAALLDFWGTVAARYKDRPCVLYEVTNEPVGGGPYFGAAANWTTTTLQDMHDVYVLMRNNAPDTHIILFSSANLYPTPAAWRTLIQNFEAMGSPIDWTKTSIGYHHYLGTYLFGDPDGFGGLHTLQSFGYPLIMTECNNFIGDAPSNDPRNSTAVWLEYEQNFISWINLDGKSGTINTQITNEILPFLASNGFPVPHE